MQQLQLRSTKEDNERVIMQYGGYDHLIDIIHQKSDKTDHTMDEIKIKYIRPDDGIPAYLMPEIKYWNGTFSCDLSLAANISPTYPEDTYKIEQGLKITTRIVQELSDILTNLN